MPDNLKQIKEFSTKPDFGDTDLLLIQGQGTTYNVQGTAVKRYAENAAKPQVELAAQQAQAAADAADRAEAAIVHPPIPDPATGNWMRWDQLTEEYVVTDIRAEGQDFEIRGFYDTFAALQAAVPNPEKGWAYGVGTEPPYEIYIWDAVGNEWKNNGPMTATGDMLKSTYDPQHKNQDVFAYADAGKAAALEAIESASAELKAEDERLDSAITQKTGRLEFLQSYDGTGSSVVGDGKFMMNCPVLRNPDRDWNDWERVIVFMDFHKTAFKAGEVLQIMLNMEDGITQERITIPAGSFIVVAFPNHNAEEMLRLVVIGSGTGTFFLDRKYREWKNVSCILYNSEGHPPAETRFVQPVGYVYGIQ